MSTRTASQMTVHQALQQCKMSCRCILAPCRNPFLKIENPPQEDQDGMIAFFTQLSLLLSCMHSAG